VSAKAKAKPIISRRNTPIPFVEKRWVSLTRLGNHAQSFCSTHPTNYVIERDAGAEVPGGASSDRRSRSLSLALGESDSLPCASTRSIFTNQQRQQVKARQVAEWRHGIMSEPHRGQRGSGIL
jgi:hypothetical protein